jgi:hypothetical protein
LKRFRSLCIGIWEIEWTATKAWQDCTIDCCQSLHEVHLSAIPQSITHEVPCLPLHKVLHMKFLVCHYTKCYTWSSLSAIPQSITHEVPCLPLHKVLHMKFLVCHYTKCYTWSSLPAIIRSVLDYIPTTAAAATSVLATGISFYLCTWNGEHKLMDMTQMNRYVYFLRTLFVVV